MLPIRARLALAAAAIPVVLAQQSLYGQCGGTGWTGATTCVAGSNCVYSNPYYSQCLPGTASTSSSSLCTSTITISTRSSTVTTFVPTPPPSSTSSSGTTTCSSYVCVDYVNSCGKTYGGCYSACPGTPKPTFTDPGCSTSTSPTKTTSTPSTTTKVGTPGAGPGTTLQPGYYWIRAVEAPNFHQYLATNPQYTTGVGVLSNYTAAGQFQIVDGQLVELISSSATNPSLLYANVGQPATPSSSLLPVTFSTTKNTFGTFSFGGDALQWSAPTVQRQNLAAWYVCAGQQVFINTGAYLYGTPAGCADETIHYYNGATAVS